MTRTITITDAPVCDALCTLARFAEDNLMAAVLVGSLLLVTIAAFSASRSAMYWRDEDKW